MNWVNAIFILLIGITVLEGIYRGFLHSALGLGAFLLSIIMAYLLYPVVSSAVEANESVFKFLIYYTEGAENISSYSDTLVLVDGITSAKLNTIISDSSLIEPFSTLIRQNVEAQAFASEGLTTIGEYFNMTIVCAVLNTLSFFAVFIIARIIFTFVLGAVNHTVQFPELKQYDRATGTLFGATRGVLLCFLIVMIIPVVFLLVPVDKIIDYYEDSSIGVFFYQNNFFLHLIRGTV